LPKYSSTSIFLFSAVDSGGTERTMPNRPNAGQPEIWENDPTRHSSAGGINLQAHGYRTSRVPCRRHHKDRQRSPQQPSRRSAAMGLSHCPGAQGRGLRTTLTPICVPAGSVSEDLSDRMRKSRILFENKRCRVSEINLSDNAGWPPPSPFEVLIDLRYECGSSQD